MSAHVQVGLVGAFQTPVAERVLDRSLEEMIFDASRAALEDAGLSLGDIDGVVLATADQLSGRVIESMVTNGAAGGVGRDVTTLASAGEHALVYAYLRLLAGQGRRLLVLSWSKASESVDPRHAERVAAEPFLLRPLGMDMSIAAGLQANAYTARYGLDLKAVRSVRELRNRAASQAHGNALDDRSPVSEGYVAWPLTEADLPRTVDTACAAVLATKDAVAPWQEPAWIAGVGWSTDRYDLAARDLSGYEALHHAARQARCADIPVDDAVFEVQEISTVGGFAAYEALGLCAPGCGAEIATGTLPRVNPSGGNLPADPGNAAGFLRILAAAQQVRGRAAVQLRPLPSYGLGATLHGFAGQGAAVIVFHSQHIANSEEVA